MVGRIWDWKGGRDIGGGSMGCCCWGCGCGCGEEEEGEVDEVVERVWVGMSPLFFLSFFFPSCLVRVFGGDVGAV